jgi:hypothetical protein
MPIKVQCACGAAFAAKDELAGRTVKCPKCQQPLAIPAAPAAAAARPAQPAAPRQVGAPLPSQAAAPPPGGDLFAEAGLHAMQAGMVPCPGCTNPMPAQAIVCIKCGYNKKIGRRMDVMKQGEGTAIPGGHGATVDEMLGAAATRIEDEKEEERKKTREGLPWWGYLIGLVCIMGFMGTMMMLPQETVLRSAPFIIYGLAELVSLYAWIRILIIAFEEGVGHGIGCLVCGLYVFVYSIMRWDRCGTLFLMIFISNFLGGVAWVGMGYMLEQMEGGDDARLSQPRPALVVWEPAWQRVPLDRDGSTS